MCRHQLSLVSLYVINFKCGRKYPIEEKENDSEGGCKRCRNKRSLVDFPNHLALVARDPIASGGISDAMRFRIHSVHRMPGEWRTTYDLYSMQVNYEAGLWAEGIFCIQPFCSRPLLQISFYYGGQRLHAPVELHASTEGGRGWFESLYWPSSDPSSEWESIPVPLMELPRETRILCILRGASTEKVKCIVMWL